LAAYEELVRAFDWEERAGSAPLLRVPVGVVAAITPWNFPISQAVDKIAAAMLAGCTVILKPSEVTPVSALAFAEAAAEAGVPAGVLNLVNGSGFTAGEALVRHPDVDMITFTGSTRVGKRIAALAAERVARVSLELGGKSATILLDDADLDEAIPAAVKACFLNSGQVCTALTRLLVPRGQLDEVVTRVKQVAEGYTVGDPDTRVDLGPLVSAAQRDRVQAYIERGIAEGARLVTGGPGAPDGLDRGYYVRPTVFADVVSSMTIAQEEIFGPVLSVLAYRDDDEAVRIANDTPYGLSGAVWSKDTDRAGNLARRLRTGMVKINGAGAAGIPFGGFKQSGVGREQGRFGLEEFLEWQAITHFPAPTIRPPPCTSSRIRESSWSAFGGVITNTSAFPARIVSVGDGTLSGLAPASISSCASSPSLAALTRCRQAAASSSGGYANAGAAARDSAA